MTEFVHAHVVRSTATISLSDLEDLNERLEERLPWDSNIVSDMLEKYEDGRQQERACSGCRCVNEEDAKFCKNCGGRLLDGGSTNDVPINAFSWFGEADDPDSFDDVFVKEVAPLIKGRLEVLLFELDQTGETLVNNKAVGFVVDDGIFHYCNVSVTMEPTLR